MEGITDKPTRFWATRYLDGDEFDGETNEEQTWKEAKKLLREIDRSFDLGKELEFRGLTVWEKSEERAKAKLDREWKKWSKELGVKDQ